MDATASMHILLLENEGITRAGYRALLADMLPAAAIHEAETYAQALAILTAQPIDFALLDYKLSGEKTGVDVLDFIRSHALGTRAIVLSGYTAPNGLADELVCRCVDAGAFGFIAKATQDVSVLRQALDAVFAGKVFFPEFTVSQGDRAPDAQVMTLAALGISGRLLQVFVCLCHAYPHKTIAKRLKAKNGAELSTGTVRNYAAMIFEKFQVKNKNELLLKVNQLGLAVPDLQSVGVTED